MLVAISTKQHERPKLKGQMEFLRPHAIRSCSCARITLLLTASSRESFPCLREGQGLALFSDHFILRSPLSARAPLHFSGTPLQCPYTPQVHKGTDHDRDKDKDL